MCDYRSHEMALQKLMRKMIGTYFKCDESNNNNNILPKNYLKIYFLRI